MTRLLPRILIWLGVMAALTLIALLVWMAVLGNDQSTEGLKWLQFLQSVGTFLLPPLVCACMWDERHNPLAWLKLNRGASWQTFLLAVVIMLCAIPGINLLADLNSRIALPESLDSIEQFLKEMEANAAALTERFLQTDSFGGLLLNLGLMALIPAMAEEFSFRGTLQQILSNSESGLTGTAGLTSNSRRRSAIAVWLTAILFSAIHMQFYGFIPRMLMGAMFGYVFVWTGCLWVPVLMHFTNNAMAVIAYYLTSGSEVPLPTNIADTIGAGDTGWLGVLSLITVGVLLWLLRRITSPGQPEYDRRTHIQ